MRKITIFIIWLTVTLTTFLSSVILFDLRTSPPKIGFAPKSPSGKEVSSETKFAALQSFSDNESISVTGKDARAELLKKYLSENLSPLAKFSDLIVSEGDKNNLDFRSLVVISQCESNLGKRIPENSYNAWGYGIYGDKILKFKNWEEGIREVSKGLRENYIEKGLETPEEIMAKYTPPSLEKGGSWAKCIRAFFKELN